MLRAVPEFLSGLLSGAFLVASAIVLLLVLQGTGREAVGPPTDSGVETGRTGAADILRRPTVPRGDYAVQSLRPPARRVPALPPGSSFGAPVVGGAVAREEALHPYRMVVPRSAGGTVPVLVLLALPASGGDSLDAWRAVAGHAGVAIVAPELDDAPAWRSTAGTRAVLEAMLLDAIRRTGLAPGPLYLHGEGPVAGTALDLAHREPDLWRAVSAHGRVAGLGPVRPQGTTLPDVAIFVGAASRGGALDAAHDAAAALSAAGHRVAVMEIERHDGRAERLGVWLPARVWAHLRSR